MGWVKLAGMQMIASVGVATSERRCATRGRAACSRGEAWRTLQVSPFFRLYVPEGEKEGAAGSGELKKSKLTVMATAKRESGREYRKEKKKKREENRL